MMVIPDLPEGTTLGNVWTSGPNDTYIWAHRMTPGTTDVPEATLYHWDGTGWEVSLYLPEYWPEDVFGTSTADVYVTASKCPLFWGAGCGSDRGGRVFRSTDGGTTWVSQVLPPEVGTNNLGIISGTPENVHVQVQGAWYIIRFDGSTWTAYEAIVGNALTFLSPNEGYYGSCYGWGWWDGNSWQYHGDQFDFCDLYGMWGMRDDTGALHLYAVGNNNFTNGVRIWKFDEACQCFVGKYDYVFADGDGYDIGSASEIWGSAPDNIYVIGRLGAWGDPTNGRLYHFDGATWQRVTEIGDIPYPGGIWGSDANNIWISLSNGQVLHYGTTLVATPDNAEVYPGNPVSVSLNIQNASDLYAAQATCTVDPAILEPQSGVFGDFFDPVNRLIGANTVDATAGTWLGAISQRSPADPLSGDGLFATVTYQALSPGTTSITCDPLLSDRDGFVLPVFFTGANITVLPFATVSGTVRYQGRLDHAGITVTATGPVTRTATTDSAGNFMLDLEAGVYQIVAQADGYLPASTTVTVTSGQAITLPGTVLKGGNANGDGAINIGDATLVAANFGLAVPPADARADINGDGIVNVQDLAILGSNYGLSGEQPW